MGFQDQQNFGLLVDFVLRQEQQIKTVQKKKEKLTTTIVIKSNANQNDKYLGKKQLGKK